MSGVDPGLRFWLAYVEHHDGLVDGSPGAALAVLPEPLQARFGLPETVTVTADPETAREDGALLLGPGHPVLSLAAEDVLAAGDVGRYALAWPGDQLPAAGDLLESARDRFPVDHGRIDLAAAPVRSYLPVLRAGAMIRYTAAGDEAFQERAECWLDAGTRREVPAAVRRALESLPAAPADSATVLPYDLDGAVGAAHEVLTAQARHRLSALDDDGRRARAEEIERTEAYYRDVLAGIERRRPGTAPERVAALDARAAATRAERSRRLAEIRDKHEPRLSLTPYRLMLVLVPAVVVPVEIKRGSRPYPQQLVWVWPARAFRPLPCPSCGADQPLVAGKTALGCRACLTRPVPSPADATTTTAKAAAKVPAKAPAKVPAKVPAKAPAKVPAKAAAAVPVKAPVSVPPQPSAARVRTLGDALPLTFWQSVVDNDRHLTKRLVPDSPAATLRRLLGVNGLVCAVGIPPGSVLEGVVGGLRDMDTGDRYVTEGELRVQGYPRVGFPFALTWRVIGGRAVVDEILPYATDDPNALPHGWFLTPGEVVLDRLPGPAALLDAVAVALTDVVLPVEGLPLLARCLTAWWRLRSPYGDGGPDPRVVAAALLRLVSWRSGARLPAAECARRSGVALAQVKAAEVDLKARLRLSAEVVW